MVQLDFWTINSCLIDVSLKMAKSRDIYNSDYSCPKKFQ